MLIAGGVVAAAALTDSGPFDDDAEQTVAPQAAAPEEATVVTLSVEIGFPASATRNTTRVPGSDPIADAAGVALASFPSAGGSPHPAAVSLVAEDDWQGGIAAASLTAAPVGAPILVGSADGLPDATEQALDALEPRGGVRTDGAQVFAIGQVEPPDDLEALEVGGRDPAARAAAIDRLRSRLVDSEPAHVVVVSQADPAFAMPAASWAARSGDPVLFTSRKGLPKVTAKALRAHRGVPVYVLGPASVVSPRVIRAIARIAPEVHRISGEDPVTNAIEFARYVDGSFGWNINDPGHGFVVAREDRPLDAAAAAPLSASGTWGPLLLTDSPDTLPGALRGYLLDVKPGFVDDPTRAVYNHIWVIGDAEAIDVNQQAAMDELAEVTRIGPDRGGREQTGQGSAP